MTDPHEVAVIYIAITLIAATLIGAVDDKSEGPSFMLAPFWPLAGLLLVVFGPLFVVALLGRKVRAILQEKSHD